MFATCLFLIGKRFTFKWLDDTDTFPPNTTYLHTDFSNIPSPLNLDAPIHVLGKTFVYMSKENEKWKWWCGSRGILVCIIGSKSIRSRLTHCTCEKEPRRKTNQTNSKSSKCNGLQFEDEEITIEEGVVAVAISITSL